MKTIFLSAPFFTHIENSITNNLIDFYNRYPVFKSENEIQIEIQKSYIKNNIQTAKKAARYLRDHDYNVFCPHTAIAGYCGDWSDDNPEQRHYILKMCEQWIIICDIFAQVPEWEKSDGCCFEYAIAQVHKKEIIYLTYGQIGI